ncbi:MAG: ATPase, T2SS/T4P/T4SS family, partial [Candidatus Micrarchaeota archaeon]
LMVNSLRMRPDRIVVGEVRRQKEAEVLFEAMHTGHSVYATLHADSANQVKGRMITPPINLPESTLEAVHIILVQYRQRRTGQRRTFEVAELVRKGLGKTDVNIVFKWNAKKDYLEKIGEYERITEEIKAYSGMDEKQIEADIREKAMILDYMVKNSIFAIEEVGRIIALYYRDREKVLEMIGGKKKAGDVLKKYGASKKIETTVIDAAVLKGKNPSKGKQTKDGDVDELSKLDMDEWKDQLNRLSSLIKREKKDR